MDSVDTELPNLPQYFTKAILLGASHLEEPETTSSLFSIKSFSLSIGNKDNGFVHDKKAISPSEFCILVFDSIIYENKKPKKSCHTFFHSRLLDYWRDRWKRNTIGNSYMVYRPQQTLLYSAELAFWPCMDTFIHSYGMVCRMDLVIWKPPQMGKNCTVSLWSTADFKRNVVLSFFRFKKHTRRAHYYSSTTRLSAFNHQMV